MEEIETPRGQFCNNSDAIYLRISGTVYRRQIGVGWSVVPEPEGLAWSELHALQWNAYKSALKDSGFTFGEG